MAPNVRTSTRSVECDGREFRERFAIRVRADRVDALAVDSGETGGVDRQLADRRLAVVRAHMEAENDHDFDAVIDTFARPRYELMGSGQVFDGEDQVRRYFALSRGMFPDQRNEHAVLRAADDMVVAEFDLLGTHRDTGRRFRSRMVALFLFEPAGERIVCERVYFDRLSIQEQVQADRGES